MPRNRVIYQSDALYVSKDISSTGNGQHVGLDRIQSANYSFTVNRQDINQFGELGRIGAVVLEPPTVNLDFTYYLTDGSNERALSFYVQNTGTNMSGEKTFLSGHMVSEFNGQNFYILTTAEGEDVNNVATAATALLSGTGYGSPSAFIKSAIGIGNAYITNYSLDASVGNMPMVSVSFEAANMNACNSIYAVTGYFATGAGVSGVYSGFYGTSLGSVNPVNGIANSGIVALTGSGFTPGNVFLPFAKSSLGASGIIALRPGDISLDLAAFGDIGSGVFVEVTGLNAIHIQSAALSIPLTRTPIQRLGSRFAFARPLDLPASATLSVSAIVNEMTAENLAAILDATVEKNISLTIRNPVGSAPAVVYTLKKCRLDSESYSSSIGGNKTIDMVFSTQYASLNDTTRGVFMSGICPGTIFGTGANGFLLSTTGVGGVASGAAVFPA
jgi:hypothetical protein